MRTAVFTVIHPRSLRSARDWYDSILAQKDQDFDLYVALDGVPTPDFMERAQLIRVKGGTTPGQIRWQAIMDLSRDYEAIIFLDSDDVPFADLVLEAKHGLETHDVYICSLQCMDQQGCSTGNMLLMPGENLEETFTEQNYIGFGNSAFRTRAFSELGPLNEANPLDWLLATWAVDRGLAVYQDRAPRIKYRLGGPGFPVHPDEAKVLYGAQIVEHCWIDIAEYMMRFGTRLEITDRVVAAAHKYTKFLKIITPPMNLGLYTSLVRGHDGYGNGWWWYVAHKPTVENLGWSL